jgi:hypothetical protein
VEPPCWYYISQSITEPADESLCGWGCAKNPRWDYPEYNTVCNTAIQSLSGTTEYQ